MNVAPAIHISGTSEWVREPENWVPFESTKFELPEEGKFTLAFVNRLEAIAFKNSQKKWEDCGVNNFVLARVAEVRPTGRRLLPGALNPPRSNCSCCGRGFFEPEYKTIPRTILLSSWEEIK
ncbi:MAG: hypothetical protein Q7S18_02320 [bacterium]|nr:hypothetical protein [bacterium]